MLLLGRHLSHEHLFAGLAVALKAGAMTSDAVASEARKTAEADQGEPASTDPPADETATLTFLTERYPAAALGEGL
ncbi:hypothetical protein SMC26_10170 [Actinomadura fulvescens]|uniref:hypothetical protein n=1 Tax=Actinomadura fulvescens TaxID=46160 RepID=UPI0031E19B4E